ncbi:MAG: LytR/AlgR family response regulator transcription factor [Saprospiraceae bacterium]
MIKAVIIDDEPDARSGLRGLLRQVDAPIEIVGEAGDIPAAQRLILRTDPDLIFLDVQLQEGTGFHLLARLPDLTAEVIFVTAYDKYAIQAFQMAAFGYLLKPLQISELEELLTRYEERNANLKTKDRNRILVDNSNTEQQKKIVLSNVGGFRVVDLSDIIYLRGEINYTRFFLKNGDTVMVSRTLRDYENMLSELGFYRCHQSFLLNLAHVVEYRKGEGGLAIMSNGDGLDISRRRKADFVSKFLG